jgi:YebC/PmpR family DNA-binding regulatory protein
MAGHSKWSNIKHRKGAQDKKRGKIFTKHIRDIMTAAKGGGDPNDNPSLRAALEKARKDNMTKDVIDRAVKRGTGELQGADYVENVYESMGPGGVAIVIRTLTDNGTRTFTNVRTAVTKNGGSLGAQGSVMWQFNHNGVIVLPSTSGEEDSVMESALEAGASDFEAEGDVYKVITEVADFGAVRDAMLTQFGEALEDPDLTYLPTNMIEITDLTVAQKVQKLVDAIDEDDDVQEVITNMDLPEEIAIQLAEEL